MSGIGRDLMFLILQYLEEEKLKDTVHKLEQESGLFFNMSYFEETVLAGDWEEVERYLSGFTKFDDNRYSMRVFFEIRKQKYLEALDRHDKGKALDILIKDLKVFSAVGKDIVKELTLLLSLENFRENDRLSEYGDIQPERALMLAELKKLIEVNPLFLNKLQFPPINKSRLRTLINQSLNWQHQLCKNPSPNADIKTLFVDHSCSQPNDAPVPSPSPPLVNVMPKLEAFPQLPFQQAAAALPTSFAGWMANARSHPAFFGAPVGDLAAPPRAHSHCLLKRPLTPPNGNPALDYHTADSGYVIKRQRPMGIYEEVGLPAAHLPIGSSGIAQSQHALDELPRTVAMTLNQGSAVMSMDFHPAQPTILLVGTITGEISLWNVASGERIAHRSFRVWDLRTCSASFQTALAKDPTVSVNRVIWNFDGTQFGVAYSQHLVHLFTYNGRDGISNHLEIEAHVGGVNDAAYSQPKRQVCIVTGGEDKIIKVWEAATGVLQHTFEGHEAPVYSIYPHFKENIPFIFSTSLDGKIKAWLYDNMGERVDYTAPGQWCTTLAYSADGTRLFSCGTGKDLRPYIVEWNESEGTIKRTYHGLRNQVMGEVKFDTIKNRFLAAGDEYMVKFWHMDNTNLLTTTDADGGLPASPHIQFNKDGALLAVSAKNNRIKILANASGQLLLSLAARSASESIPKEIYLEPAIRPLGSVSAMAGTSASVADRGAPVTTVVAWNEESQSLEEVKPRIIDESIEKSKIWKLAEINEPSQCRSLRLPDSLVAAKVPRLIYTNSGHAILALTSNAVHKLWKWQETDRNTPWKATTSIPPQLWQPSSGILMTNEIGDARTEEIVHCLALSKNDSYAVSASGGKISLFNMVTFKTVTTIMHPSPAATFLAFHPQDNNIIAIGMEDSTIQIYNVRIDEVKSNLRGHQKRITGLAFSNMLNILVSSGADAQLCIWAADGWEKQSNKFLQIPSGRMSGPLSKTEVQFHNDQLQLLVVHDTQLAIYDAGKLECLKQWVPRDGIITHATYSCDSQMIYASFVDGSVSIFTADLRLRCRISPSAYLNAQPSSNLYPLVIAAHPSEPNQFALGLTDGGVLVLEPLESEGKWGTALPAENGV
ncbi:protein TOPLESS-like isoform X2 [Phoenix dactylifera]|uniref:Protein TOPLESS-like isoform X2 n=1 Tax=Phoenix dactylifera TaxID=42345 RepID=A0A8B7MVN0_PHODC|nr:protein TOPLESS-like isoform X2 [Phoenix dactylifera]